MKPQATTIPEEIGPQKFVKQYWLCGRTDEAMLLSTIVGVAHGSGVACENKKEIEELLKSRFITTRLHVAPLIPDTWLSYALTPSGFQRLAKIGHGDMHDAAVRRHKWYAEHGSLNVP